MINETLRSKNLSKMGNTLETFLSLKGEKEIIEIYPYPIEEPERIIVLFVSGGSFELDLLTAGFVIRNTEETKLKLEELNNSVKKYRNASIAFNEGVEYLDTLLGTNLKTKQNNKKEGEN